MASNAGDLTDLAKEIEAVFMRHFKGKPAMAIAFTLPPDYKEVHWITNVSREDGIIILAETALEMDANTK